MNRRDRRKAAKLDRAKPKLSRDATPEEVFPDDLPGRGHAPIQSAVVDVMRLVVDTLRQQLPGFEVTLFVAESHELTKGKRLPRFNYMSSAEREDMLAVLKAFIAKNERDGSVLDRINNPPPTGRVQ